MFLKKMVKSPYARDKEGEQNCAKFNMMNTTFRKSKYIRTSKSHKVYSFYYTPRVGGFIDVLIGE
ncbi:hypothetical protein J2Z23_001084 [Lederbergia galactosidilyticus]|uniref:Uncharacterized protein n=1 Tax=Lederbergia galactosidilytica TaxID=217031 RepID=A0A177ZHF8_9BACI|nr:hypothetical protein [Lederbergia galactosidilytica]OAK67401.1 hypothetical protein ABB05_19845 [Lederbergia galactosidilytica]